MRPAQLFFFLMVSLLLGCTHPAPTKQSLSAEQSPSAKVTEPADTTPEDDSEYLESDGSLETILDQLKGKNAPVFDTSFHVLNPNDDYEQYPGPGECHLRRLLKFPGYRIALDLQYQECPPGPYPFFGFDPQKVNLHFNEISLNPEGYRYQISGDSVSLDWDFSGQWRKMKFYQEVWLVGDFANPACNGSTCMYGATLLAKMDSTGRSVYFFDHFPQPGILADSDGDKRLEWLELDFGDWQQDTIHLEVTPYELNDKGKFKPMKDALGKPYQASIQFENGLYEPRNARLLTKHWPN